MGRRERKRRETKKRKRDEEREWRISGMTRAARRKTTMRRGIQQSDSNTQETERGVHKRKKRHRVHANTFAHTTGREDGERKKERE